MDSIQKGIDFIFASYKHTAAFLLILAVILVVPIFIPFHSNGAMKKVLGTSTQGLLAQATDKLPVGYFDGVDNASCSVNGWSADPDNVSSNLAIHIYRDGNTFVGATTANISRPDVAAAGYPGNHGYNMVLPTTSGVYDGQPHQIYIYAIDSQDTNQHSLLGNSPKTITCNASSATPTNTPTPLPTTQVQPSATTVPVQKNLPVGFFDGVDNASCTVNGWTADPDDLTAHLQVHAYRDGTPGTYLGSTTANVSRPDVAANGYPGDHGFNITFGVSSGLQDGQPHQIYIYGIDAQDTNQHTLLANSPKTITCPQSPCFYKPKGDINCDKKINLDDFNVWKSDFLWNLLPSHADEPQLSSDINGDHKVTTDDFNIWRDGFLNPSLPH